MTIIQKFLKRGYARTLDVTTFTKYHYAEIDLQECKKQFFENNKVPVDYRPLITDEMFKEWLKSIGYRRGDNE